MSALIALAQQQPVALWLGAGALLLALAVATGLRGAVWAAAGGPLAAVVALVAPRASLAQAAAFVLAASALAALAARRDLRARPARTSTAAARPETPADAAVDARLLGRVVRAARAFGDGGGEVLVDGALRPAVLADGGPPPGADARLRVVRVGGTALAVRPLDAA